VNFVEAVQSVLSKYAVFSGRARRSEYWWFALFNIILSVVTTVVDRAIGNPALGLIVSLGLLLPSIAVGVRRLHDTDRSGWWMFIALVPLVGAIVLIVFLCQDSRYGDNKYGPSPKREVQGGYAGGYPVQS
jgi:uncharacterized membrane protein YhaH (DUF805 family)